ncbi:MAG: putative porin [Bernardetiaceae bacterium]|jgi:hypothetical protein|nr:putative porin [Bernardetiaceae bacterium]
MPKGWICGLLLAIMGCPALAQTPAPDTSPSDTTKKTKQDSIKYGPYTVFYLWEGELYRNRAIEQNPDTALSNRHRYNAVQANGFTWQDLGVNGQAAQPIFYQLPPEIGTRLGYHLYNSYLIDPAQVPHYNTYSPYTDIDYVQGGKGRPRIRIAHSRNLNPNWNITLHFRRQEANRIFNRVAYRNDAVVSHQTIGLQTRFVSKNERYRLLASFFNYNHAVRENGGYGLTATGTDTVRNLRELLDAEDSQLRYQLLAPGQPAQNATALPAARQAGNTFRLYHELDFFKNDTARQARTQLQLFHLAEWRQQTNSYTDERWQANVPNFYRQVAFDPNRRAALQPRPGEELPTPGTTAVYSTRFTQLDNRAGLKGKLGEFRYRAYARLRNYQFQANFIDSLSGRDSTEQWPLAAELFVGGGLDYTFKDSSRLEVELEHLLLRDYRLRGGYSGRWFSLAFEQAFYTPDLVQQRLFGTFARWDNGFVNTLASQIRFSINQFRVPGLNDSTTEVRLSPFALLNNVSNLVYYDTLGRPRQANQDVRQLQIGGQVRARWRQFHNVLQLTYTQNLRADLVRVPRFVVTNQIYWERKAFTDALEFQLGLDLMWKSAFLANAYRPQIQQFHLQNQFMVDNFLVADVFANFKIARAWCFIKVNNALQDLLGRGYFGTPRYFAQPRSLELGVRWLFFD